MTKILNERPEWQALISHQKSIANHHMRDWFKEDKDRFDRFSFSCGEIFFDYSRNRINESTIKLLIELATATNLQQKIDDLFAGVPINITEKRPALHSALRDKNHRRLMVNGENIAEIISKTQDKMRAFTTKIHKGAWLGVTGKPIKHIVNIGIGGSHLGPMMCTYALQDFAHPGLQFHFISSVDKAGLIEVLNQIDPETSLFIISSKTFSTIETLTNAQTISAWIQDKLGAEALKHHFIAITTAKEKAKNFGIDENNIFPLWDWVGGRYSVWSAIGLPLLLMLGTEQYDEFLTGAHEMDQHFKSAPFEKNMPVLLALLGIWYFNFFSANVQAIIPYAQRLRYLIPYLQQADMESNGKSISLSGMNITYATGPVIFGEEGCNGQHAYHQLLLQGKHFIPVDFILVGDASDKNGLHQDILVASGISQAQALMRGKTFEEAYQELIVTNYSEEEALMIARHKMIPGNRPSNILFLERLTPKNLGALIALYEHKIFVQGAVWDINSFDQWGVELGKQLLPAILQYVQNEHLTTEMDSATLGLINLFKKVKHLK